MSSPQIRPAPRRAGLLLYGLQTASLQAAADPPNPSRKRVPQVNDSIIVADLWLQSPTTPLP